MSQVGSEKVPPAERGDVSGCFNPLSPTLLSGPLHTSALITHVSEKHTCFDRRPLLPLPPPPLPRTWISRPSSIKRPGATADSRDPKAFHGTGMDGTELWRNTCPGVGAGGDRDGCHFIEDGPDDRPQGGTLACPSGEKSMPGWLWAYALGKGRNTD